MNKVSCELNHLSRSPWIMYFLGLGICLDPPYNGQTTSEVQCSPLFYLEALIGKQAHLFSSAGQFVSNVMVVVLERSPVRTAKRWPSGLTSYNGSVRSGRLGKSS